MAMDGCPQRQLSTGRLVRPASQGGRRPTGLLSVATAERLRDPPPQKYSRWASPVARPLSLGATSSRPGSRAGSRPGSRAGSRPQSSTTTPVKKRMVWSQEQLDLPELSGTSRHDRSISWCTKRENLSKEQASVRLDSSQEVSSSGMAQPDQLVESPGAPKETIETVAAAFTKEVTAIDRRIEDLGKSLLMNHLLKDAGLDAESAARDAREADRKRREAELRKARLKEKAARDPHKKIQLRLETKRRFEMDTLDKVGIPTTTLGLEKIKIVDVLCLRNKCQGLTEGIHSVHELVELQQRREKSLRLSSISAPGSLMMSSSMPLMSTASSNDTLLPSQMSWEERSQRASLKRRCLTSENIVRKLNMMSYPPDRLPQAYDVFDYCAPESRGVWGSSSLGCISRGDSLNNSLEEQQTLRAPIARRRSLGGAGADEAAVEKTNLREVKSKEVDEEVLKRVKHLWVCVRGFARFLTVYFAHRRRLHSADTIRKFVLQLGEWARIKNAMKRTVADVIGLQRMCRRFFSMRSRRCEAMHKEWERIENNYLQSYFRVYALRCMEDRSDPDKLKDGDFFTTPTGKKVARAETRKLQEQHIKISREDTSMIADRNARAMRIPGHVRKGIICRYYMVELYKHMRIREDMVRTVRNTMEYQRDLAQIMKCFGAKPPQQAELLSETCLDIEQVTGYGIHEFWHLKEETVISLVCLAANHLQKTNDTFKNHPGTQHGKMLEHEFDKFCRPPQRLPYEVKLAVTAELEQRIVRRDELFWQADRQTRAASKETAARPEPQGAQTCRMHFPQSTTPLPKGGTGSPGAKTSAERGVTFASDESRRPLLDLDDVWREFSPRLQDIVEKQTAEWRDLPQEHDDRLDELRLQERINQLA